jgi:hypothetical protein
MRVATSDQPSSKKLSPPSTEGVRVQPRGQDFMPNSAEDEAIQRRLPIFNNQQGLEQVWWRSAVFRLEGFRQLNTFKAHSDKKAALSAIEPQWLFSLVRIGRSTQVDALTRSSMGWRRSVLPERRLRTNKRRPS